MDQSYGFPTRLIQGFQIANQVIAQIPSNNTIPNTIFVENQIPNSKYLYPLQIANPNPITILEIKI